MNRERIIRLLEEQLGFAREQVRQQSEQLSAQSDLINRLTLQITELTTTVKSLEQSLSDKVASLEKEKNTKKALGKLLGAKSEKIVPVRAIQTAVKEQGSFKARGNNGALRKEHFELEVQQHDVYPTTEDFDAEGKKPFKTTQSIRYEYIPGRFIKHIYHLHHFIHRQSVITAQAPAAPLLNSNYHASFLAGILQLRYIYSMPVERIVKLFAESGFELNKSTAHHLVKRAAQQFDYLGDVLRQAILADGYIHMDESHYTILEPAAESATGRSSSKGYIWGALASTVKLVHFFYKNGSRGRKVMTDYIPASYRGAIQSDGLANYKILETRAYPHTIRLCCLQHCKRKFLDIGSNPDAHKVVGIMNKLYSEEHKIPPEASPGERLKYKQQYGPPILKELKQVLLEIKNRKTTLPKSAMARAVNYTLGEYPALCNYLLAPEYELDNNAMERLNRYISLSRRNSLFCASHKGAERAALIYSLAVSCRMHNINTFEYFKDLLNKLIYVNPNTNKEVLRNLLPDKWTKQGTITQSV